MSNEINEPITKDNITNNRASNLRKRNSSNFKYSTTQQALKSWIKDTLGRARKSVAIDSPKIKIFLQVYTPTHKRAVRILKLPKNLF